MNKIYLNVKNNIESILFFAFPLFFLTIKSYSNTILVLMVLYSLIRISIKHNLYITNRDNKFWLFLVIITIPFTTELMVEILRDGFHYKALDAPLRFLAAGIIFAYFSKSDLISKHFQYFSLGCMISVFVTLATILVFREHYWGSRVASYFSDPNTIAVYCVVLFFSSFFYTSRLKSVIIQLIIHSTLLFSTIYIIIYSGTRTAWISFIIVLILKFLLLYKKNNYFFLYIFSFIISIICLYFIKPDIYDTVNNRYSTTVDSINNYSPGVSTQYSTGIRLNLFLIDLEIIKNYFWFGIPDGKLPPLEYFKLNLPSIGEIEYNTRLLSGSHVEILAQMARKGFVFGLLSTISLFIIPLIMSFKSAIYTPHKNFSMCTGLLVILCLLVSSFGIQVFSLKMTSSFWAIFLALIYSSYYQISDRPNQDS